MSDKKTPVESIADKIKRAAKEAEDFANKVTADEEPVVVDETSSETPASKASPN